MPCLTTGLRHAVCDRNAWLQPASLCRRARQTLSLTGCYTFSARIPARSASAAMRNEVARPGHAALHVDTGDRSGRDSALESCCTRSALCLRADRTSASASWGRSSCLRRRCQNSSTAHEMSMTRCEAPQHFAFAGKQVTESARPDACPARRQPSSGMCCASGRCGRSPTRRSRSRRPGPGSGELSSAHHKRNQLRRTAPREVAGGTCSIYLCQSADACAW